MATTPTPVPTTSVNELTPEQIADQLAQQVAPASTEPAPLERDFSVVLGTGQTYKGPTKDAVIQQLVKAQEEASKRIKELSDAAKAPVSVATPLPTPAVAEPTFDNNKYYQLLAESPIAANSYMLQFTPEAQELRNQTQKLVEFQQGMQTQAQVNQFKAEAPDFPLDDASTQKFEETWNKMGLAITTQNLKLVHGYCLANKIYAPHSDTQVAALTTAQPLPTLSGGGTAVQSQQQDVNSMTPEQIEALIQSLNGQR